MPDAVGSELEVLAVAPDGSVEAVADRARALVAVMWHPERSPDDDADLALVAALAAAH
jgi:gamma-glutamyl-gamma-aminobutyrate hydrolase PuuD